MYNSNPAFENTLSSVMFNIEQRNFSVAVEMLRSMSHITDPRLDYLSGTLAQAMGNFSDARSYYEKVVAQAVLNDELVADSILRITLCDGIDLAHILNSKALIDSPDYFGHHYCKGLISLHKYDLNRAVTAFLFAAQLNPDCIDAVILAAQVQHMLGDYANAKSNFDIALRSAPNSPKLHEGLAALFIDSGSYDSAYRHSKNAIEFNPQSVSAWSVLSASLRHLKQPEKALFAAQRACQLSENDAEARRMRGLAFKELGRLKDAASDLLFCTQKRFAPNSHSLSNMKEHHFFSRAKLEHDTEQYQYLSNRYKNMKFDQIYRNHKFLLEKIDTADKTKILPIPYDAMKGLQSEYNRLHNLASTEYKNKTALSETFDGPSIEGNYFRQSPGITWIDDFLTQDALNELRKYCLESTIWFDFNHTNGYLGASFENGFADALLLQICDELRARLPNIFLDYSVMQMWAFKYDSTLSGINLHADIAAVNLNFWITPDDANLEPQSGGLRVWDKKAPEDWGFDEFNGSSEKAQSKIKTFLADTQASEIVIPYRQNRAVLFNSDLFHATDEFHFKPGYENRRINITMLFGKRQN
jgi:tetratricopeptide (TPR) repeat protein